MRRTVTAAVGIAVLATLAACGGTDPAPDTAAATTQPTTPSAPAGSPTTGTPQATTSSPPPAKSGQSPADAVRATVLQVYPDSAIRQYTDREIDQIGEVVCGWIAEQKAAGREVGDGWVMVLGANNASRLTAEAAGIAAVAAKSRYCPDAY